MGIRGYKKKVTPSPEVYELKRMIDKWREHRGLEFVQSRLVVPDTSNRSHTALSVDHCHLIATMMLVEGFRERIPVNVASSNRSFQHGHDIPVLVRGKRENPVDSEGLAYWREATNETKGFPTVKISEDDDTWFCSLGNGHFMQALNLIQQNVENVFTGHSFQADPSDLALARALTLGVESIVLRSEMPISDRRRLALLLNKTHDYKWTVDDKGAMDIRPEVCHNARHTLFEARSKVMDSGDLTLMVRLELGRTTDDRTKIPAGRDGTPYPKSKQLMHLGLDRPLKRIHKIGKNGRLMSSRL